MRLAVLAAVRFSGNGALSSSSRVTLCWADAGSIGHTIASASRNHFFIFISDQVLPNETRKHKGMPNRPAGARRAAQSKSSGHPVAPKFSAHSPVPEDWCRFDRQLTSAESDRKLP